MTIVEFDAVDFAIPAEADEVFQTGALFAPVVVLLPALAGRAPDRGIRIQDVSGTASGMCSILVLANHPDSVFGRDTISSPSGVLELTHNGKVWGEKVRSAAEPVLVAAPTKKLSPDDVRGLYTRLGL